MSNWAREIFEEASKFKSLPWQEKTLYYSTLVPGSLVLGSGADIGLSYLNKKYDLDLPTISKTVGEGKGPSIEYALDAMGLSPKGYKTLKWMSNIKPVLEKYKDPMVIGALLGAVPGLLASDKSRKGKKGKGREKKSVLARNPVLSVLTGMSLGALAGPLLVKAFE